MNLPTHSKQRFSVSQKSYSFVTPKEAEPEYCPKPEISRMDDFSDAWSLEPWNSNFGYFFSSGCTNSISYPLGSLTANSPYHKAGRRAFHSIEYLAYLGAPSAYPRPSQQSGTRCPCPWRLPPGRAVMRHRHAVSLDVVEVKASEVSLTEGRPELKDIAIEINRAIQI